MVKQLDTSSLGYNRRNSIRSNERHQRLAALPHRAAVSLSTRERKRSLHRSKGLELLRGEADRGGCEILLKMGDRGRSRNWQYSGRTLQQPSERDLAWRRAVALGNSGKRGVWTRKPARSKRVPRNKGDTSFGANVDQPVGGSIPEIVAILDGHDRGHGARSPELPLEGASGPVELSALNWPVSASSINVHAFGSVQRVQPARSALHECCTSRASRSRWRRRPRVLRRALMRGELITKLVKITVFNRPAEYVVQIDR